MDSLNQTNTNPELELAYKLVEQTGTSIFLTGKAGTGKTTFLRTLTKKSPKRMIILAPTGIAAINAGGMTIHSFFQLPFAPYIPGTAFGGDAKYRFQFGKEKLNIIRSIDLLVIDEISMVRADLLDAIDDILRRFRKNSKPFGGVQLLLIGDIQQLPPVAKNNDWELLSKYYDTQYFFSSHALKESEFCTIELTKVYRQNDTHFLDILNAIREDRCTPYDLKELNKRYIPELLSGNTEGYIQLTTHNNQAQHINITKLKALSSRSYRYKATIEGNFPEYSYPTEFELELKDGAQVMFVKNDISGEHRYANGTIGKITRLSADSIEVSINENGIKVDVSPEEWANARYRLDEETKEIVEEIEGIFKQFPLKLAWAITIHKSQGLTFDHAIIDLSSAFTHGQTYVALSRCRTLEGLLLSAPVPIKAIICDDTVRNFREEANKTKPTNEKCTDMQRAYFIDLLKQLYEFRSIEMSLRHYVRIVDEYLYNLYPKQLELYKKETERFKESVTKVGVKFEQQYIRLINSSANYSNDTKIQERIHSASEYFLKTMLPLKELIEPTDIDTDNKELKKRLKTAYEELIWNTDMKISLLEYVLKNGFDVSSYLRQRAIISIEDNTKKKREAKSMAKSVIVNGDIENPALYKELVEWRRKEAFRLGLPAYTVLQQKAILGLSNNMPENKKELLRIPCIGKKTVEKYGEILVSIIEKYKKIEVV